MNEITRSTSRPLELTELLTLMIEVGERINSTLDLDELLARIAEIVKRAIDYEVFAILLLNEKTQELRVHFSLGHPRTGAKPADQGGRGHRGPSRADTAFGPGE